MKKYLSLILILTLTVLTVAGCKNSEEITEEKAKAIALEHAGITADQAEGLIVVPDRDDGRQYYDIRFYHDGYEYDYEILAKNGKIADYDKEYEPRPDHGSDAATDTDATVNANTAVTDTGNPQEAAITKEQAEEIALKHAGLSREAVSGLRTEFDRDRVDHYEVSFYQDRYEYDYEIDAQTGAVLDFDKEYDD